MKKKTLIAHYKTVAIAILSLGIIHTIATPVVAKDLSLLDKEVFNTFLLMFIATGVAMINAGILFLYDIKRMKETIGLSIIPISSIIFTTIVGILACIFGSDNPFAWITLAVGIYGLAITIYHLSLQKRIVPNIHS